jgi:hypothetical protein
MIRYILIFIIGVFPLLSAPVEFRLSSTEVGKGEILQIDAIASGTNSIHPTSKVFTEGRIKAVYSGIMTETKIINFNASQNTIIKFQIIETKPGKYKVPPITVTMQGVNYTIPDQYFVVSDRLPTPSSPANNPFLQNPLNRLFEQDIVSPWEEGDSFLRFEVSKNKIYLGEPIIGYFILYNKNSKIPFFERNPNESIAFPFFTSELLTGVEISYPNKVSVVKGGKEQEFYTAPYNREIYALTPLKVGKYRVGETKFDLSMNQRMQFLTKTLPVEPKEIEVEQLPPGAPPSFSGEVGEMEIRSDYSGMKVEEGSSWQYKAIVQGYGLCNRVKDPIIDYIPKHFPGRILSLGVQRSQKFIEIKSGEFGFSCEAIFEYSVNINSNSPAFYGEVSYFHPGLQNYDTKKVLFPKLEVIPKSHESLLVEEGEDYSEIMHRFPGWTIAWVIVSFSILLGCSWYYIQKLRPKQVKKFEYLLQLDKIAGSKSGLLLEEALKKNGYGMDGAKYFRELREKYIDVKFTEILTLLDYREKELLNQFITQGDKNE